MEDTSVCGREEPKKEVQHEAEWKYFCSGAGSLSLRWQQRLGRQAGQQASEGITELAAGLSKKPQDLGLHGPSMKRAQAPSWYCRRF
jgi:hypothetical protein